MDIVSTGEAKWNSASFRASASRTTTHSTATCALAGCETMWARTG